MALTIDQARRVAERLKSELWKEDTIIEEVGALYYHASGTGGHCVVWDLKKDTFVDYQAIDEGGIFRLYSEV